MLKNMSEIEQKPTTETVRRCASQGERAIRLLGDMWILLLVNQLATGPKRFGELLEALGNVSPKTVSQRLKLLEEHGSIERCAYAEIPPRVVYHLTEKGLALLDILGAIQRYGELYLDSESEPPPITE